MTRLKNKSKPKSKKAKWIKRSLISLSALTALAFASIMIFFHTNLFEKERDLWVQTAMATTSHKWLATSFLSSSEVQAILDKYEVKNTTNSTPTLVSTETSTSSSSSSTSSSADNVSVKKITGSTYTGYVMTIKDPSTVTLATTLTSSGNGIDLSTTMASGKYTAAINAGGFEMASRGGSGGTTSLASATISNGKLIYGDASTTYQWIGMSADHKLILGNYTYAEAIKAGIIDGIEFGPYLIVDGKDQVTDSTTGGLQPRTAIGQAADGTIYMVVIEGRSATSQGATLYDLQKIFDDLDVVNAANLDGGGSSEMYYNGSLVNALSNGSERALTTAFLVS